jgi:hypothetical protein
MAALLMAGLHRGNKQVAKFWLKTNVHLIYPLSACSLLERVGYLKLLIVVEDGRQLAILLETDIFTKDGASESIQYWGLATPLYRL